MLITIGQLKQQGDSKIREVFTRLRNAIPPIPSSYSKSKQYLVPFDTKDRKKALAARIKQLGYNITKIKYKAQFGYYNSASLFAAGDDSSTVDSLLIPPMTTPDDIQFPFLVEVAVIHTSNLPYNLFYCEGINASAKYYYSFLYGDELTWTSRGGKENVAYGVQEIMEKYGYSTQKEKSKKPRSIIVVNLWSPKIEYTDYGKSQIDLKPFSETIADTLYKVCSGSSNREQHLAADASSDKRRAIEIF